MLFCGQGISGPCRRQLRDSAEISGMELRYFNGLISLQYIEFSGFHLHIFIHVVDHILRFQHAGIYLDHGIFTDERIYDSLPYHSGFRFGEVIICFKYLIGLHIHAGNFSVLRAREIFQHIIQQCVNTLTEHVRAHGNGNHAAVHHADTQSRTDLRLGESLSAEITLHKLFGSLRNRL